MPRQARLDVPGTYHHVIVRGIEKRQIIDDDKDKKSFVDRMGSLVLETDTAIYAWKLNGKICSPISCLSCHLLYSSGKNFRK